MKILQPKGTGGALQVNCPTLVGKDPQPQTRTNTHTQTYMHTHTRTCTNCTNKTPHNLLYPLYTGIRPNGAGCAPRTRKRKRTHTHNAHTHVHKLTQTPHNLLDRCGCACPLYTHTAQWSRLCALCITCHSSPCGESRVCTENSRGHIWR